MIILHILCQFLVQLNDSEQDWESISALQKIGHPGTADFLYSFDGGGPYKTPSKGGPLLVKVKLLKLCMTTI